MPYQIEKTNNNLRIEEQQYAYGDTIQFSNMTSCLSIVGKVQVEETTQLLGVHLVQVGIGGSFDQVAASKVAQLFEEGSNLALIGYETWSGEGSSPLDELISQLQKINGGPLDAEYTNGEGGFENGKPYKASLKDGTIKISRELSKQEEAAQATQEAKEAEDQEKKAKEMLEEAIEKKKPEEDIEVLKELVTEAKERKEAKAKEAIEKSQQAQQETLENTLRAQTEQVVMIAQYQTSSELEAISTHIVENEAKLKNSTPDDLGEVLKIVNTNIDGTIKPALNTYIETASQEAVKAEDKAWQESMKIAQENIDAFKKQYESSDKEIEEMKELIEE